MGVNISGSGIFSGIASFIMGSIIQPLRTLLYTYTTTGTPGTQGGSYYTTYVGSASNGYVMLSYDGKIYYTSDLQSEWTFTADIGSWAWFPPEYIPETSMFFAGSQYGRTAYSYDGLNWTMGDVVFPNEGFNTTVYKYANGIFIAMNTAQGKTAYSYDGLNWTYNSQSLNDILGPVSGMEGVNVGYMQKIEELLGNFVISGNYGAIARSSDGINWTVIDSGRGSNSHSNIIKINNTLYIPLRDGGILMSSDAISWTHVTAFPAGIYDLVRSNGVWIGTPNSWQWGQSVNTVYTGASLSSMTATLTAPALDVVVGDPAFGDSRAVIVDYNGGLYYSLNSDYSSWNYAFQIPGDYLANSAGRMPLSYQDGVYVLLSTNFNTNTTSIWSSQDGMTWSYQTLSSFTIYPFEPKKGTISTLREVQTVIGGQGEEGSFVESLSPVVLVDLLDYHSPGDTTNLNVTVRNSSSSDQYVTSGFSYDGGITIDPDIIWSRQNLLVPAGQTVTLYDVTGYWLIPWQQDFKIYVMATAADVLTFNVNGV